MSYNIKLPSRSEVLYQLAFLLIAGVFFLFDRHDEVMDIRRLPSFIVFALIALFVGYVLLPLFYARKHVQFFMYFFLSVLFAILLEEFVIEKIFYPDTRGQHFHGLAMSLLEVMPILLLLVSFKFAWDLHQKQKALEKLQMTAKESELKYLKSQINPHFLFNNLNNLYSYSITDPEKSSTIILELSAVLRYMLYDCKAEWVPLDKELSHLKNFVNLHELQIEDRGEVHFVVDNQSSGYTIAPLILVAFIENAFKHSTASVSQGINIAIKVKVDEYGHLHFRCQNNFEILGNNDNLSSGIGLENVKRRLTILYPNAHDLVINNENGIYTVELKLKLSKKEV